MNVHKSNFLLLLAAAIWGFAFVAQRVGMDYVGPFTYTGVRFLLGGISLLPLILFFRTSPQDPTNRLESPLIPGLVCGTVLFIAASLQQVGLIHTTAGKAAFITGLYVMLVPIIGIYVGQKVKRGTWIGCLLAITGLYLLSVRESTSIQPGDMLELIGAFFWAIHIHVIGYYSRRVDVIKLSCCQCITCSLLSLLVAAATETILISQIIDAAIPILYGGVCSVGIAYTLQVVGQRHAPPAHAAIIFSMETVFGLIGGFLILGERMQGQEIFGCALMLTGMLVSQLQNLSPSD